VSAKRRQGRRAGRGAGAAGGPTAERRAGSVAAEHTGTAPGAPSRPAALLLAALAVLTLWVALRWLSPQAWSYDEYYHLGVARELRTQPLLRDFRWAPFSVLHERWADKEPLLHYAVAPFATLPFERASLIAVALGQLLLVGAFAHALWRLRVPFAPWLMFALAALGPLVTQRAEMARPHVWLLAACLLGLTSLLDPRRGASHFAEGAAEGASRFAGGAAGGASLFGISALAGLAHAGGWLVTAFALLRALLDRWLPGERQRLVHPWRDAAVAAAGWLAGQLIHPQVPHNFRLLWLQNVVVPLQSTAGRGALHTSLGTELQPPEPALLAQQWPALLVAAALVALLVRHAALRRRDVLTVALPALGFLLVGCLLMRRFLELGAPLALLALGLALGARAGATTPRTARRRPRQVALALAIAAGIVWSLYANLLAGYGLASPPRPMAEWLARHGRAGERVFTAQWADSAPLLYFAPQLESLVALDPTFFWARDPRLFVVYENLVAGRTARPAAVIRERFAARWVTVWTPGYQQLARQLAATPGVTMPYADAQYAVFDLGAGGAGPTVDR
jgi:hypothetical protein